MNIEQQLEPGPGPADKLAGATLADLISELKTRCLCLCVVMYVTDDSDGEEALLVKSMGPRMAMLGAAEVIRQHYLEHDFRILIDG